MCADKKSQPPGLLGHSSILHSVSSSDCPKDFDHLFNGIPENQGDCGRSGVLEPLVKILMPFHEWISFPASLLTFLLFRHKALGMPCFEVNRIVKRDGKDMKVLVIETRNQDWSPRLTRSLKLPPCWKVGQPATFNIVPQAVGRRPSAVTASLKSLSSLESMCHVDFDFEAVLDAGGKGLYLLTNSLNWKIFSSWEDREKMGAIRLRLLGKTSRQNSRLGFNLPPRVCAALMLADKCML